MGVRGLTTYINSNSHTFFLEFKLYGCTVVIDGNSLAAVLYSDTLGPYSAFGGDYDVFAEQVENFIINLKQCNVEPLFIFDGGYERKKASTVRKRNALKVFAIDKVNPNRPAREFFPFMMRPVLQERLIELGVTCLQSDYEADQEIAAIAKRINAPVLSNDSDFFIFDVPFIPLSRFSFKVCRTYKSNVEHYYIPCQIFYVENFLQPIGGLEKNMLPLLATVLGNDYLNGSTFKNFFGLIKMDKNKKITLGQRRIGGLVKWLKKETFDTALKKILTSLPKNRRSQVKRRIYSIVNSYSNLSTCLDTFLPNLIKQENQSNVNFDQICSHLNDLNINDSGTSYTSSNNRDEYLDEEIFLNPQNEIIEDEVADDEDIIIKSRCSQMDLTKIPHWFFDRSRRCQIAPQVITLLTLNTYFCVPQIEDCTLPHAGEIGLPILHIIAGLTSGKCSITYWHRHGSSAYRARKLENVNICMDRELPSLPTIHNCSFEVRKNILLDTLKIENDFILESFPEEWHLLVMCLVYWIKSSQALKSFHIHAVIMMIIIVNVYSTKIGFFRKTSPFAKKYGAKVNTLQKLREKTFAKFIETEKTVVQLLSEVTIDDCLVNFEGVLPNFNIDCSLKVRPRSFQRPIVHCFAELQTVLDLVQTLNSLLLQPYKRMQISRFYNGTFVYNLAADFKHQPNVIKYLEKLFMKSPIIINLHMSFFKELSKYMNETILIPSMINNKRRKKRKKKVSVDSTDKEEEEGKEDEQFHDENNRFSLLQNHEEGAAAKAVPPRP